MGPKARFCADDVEQGPGIDFIFRRLRRGCEKKMLASRHDVEYDPFESKRSLRMQGDDELYVC